MNAIERPIGPVVDTAAAEPPGPVTLEGRFALIEKLHAVHHADALWQEVKDDDAIWDYMGYGPFRDEAAFTAWVESRVPLTDPYSYAVVDKADGRAKGIVTLMEIRPAMRVIEIGNIVYGTGLQRQPAATEAQYLVARYVFETLGYRRYEWKCNALNAPSQRAARRFGFSFEGVFRQHMIIKGRNRDTAWFAMTDGDWPARKAAFERWLSPDNFDGAGRQRVSLAELNASTQS